MPAEIIALPISLISHLTDATINGDYSAIGIGFRNTREDIRTGLKHSSTYIIEIPGRDCGAGGPRKCVGGAQKLVEVVGPEVVSDEAEDGDPDVGLQSRGIACPSAPAC